MGKLLLLGLPIVTVVIPIRCAKAENPRRAFGRTVVFMGVFAVWYMFSLYFIYPRLG